MFLWKFQDDQDNSGSATPFFGSQGRRVDTDTAVRRPPHAGRKLGREVPLVCSRTSANDGIPRNI